MKIYKLERIYRINASTSFEVLNSHLFNLGLMPTIWEGEEKGYNYQFKLVKSTKNKKFLFFWTKTKTYVEYVKIIATDKYGVEKKEYGTKLIINSEKNSDEMSKDIHYWIERLVRENLHTYWEVFKNN
jgi:hypothetical protein